MKRYLLAALFAAGLGISQQGSYKATGTGSVARSISSKLGDVIHAKDFGAVCDGTVGSPGTDNIVAFQAAITAAGPAGQVVFPTGKCSFSATLQPAGNEQSWQGAGAGATQLNYTGSGDAVFIPDGLQLVSMTGFGITIGNFATVVALHLQGGPSGNFRNSFRNVSIYRQGGPNPVAGQKGIWLEYTSGANGPWFNQFSDIWISFIDQPLVISAQANQNRFTGVSFEAFGTGALGSAISIEGSENVFAGLVFSRGNGTATTTQGIACNACSYNQFSGAVSDLGTGQLFTFGATSTLNVLLGGDASSGGGGANASATNIIWPAPGGAFAVPKIRPSVGNLTLDSAGGNVVIPTNALNIQAGAFFLGTARGLTFMDRASVTWDPPSVAAGAQTTASATITNSLMGDICIPTFSLDLQAMQLTAYMSVNGTCTVVLQNGTAGAIDLASGTLKILVLRMN